MSEEPWSRPQQPPVSDPVGVVLAVAGASQVLAQAVDRSGTGLKVVRQCANVTELLSVGLARKARLAVLDTALPELDRTVAERLRHVGVCGVLLVGPGEGDWEQPGWTVLPRQCPVETVVRHLQQAAVVGEDGEVRESAQDSEEGEGPEGKLVVVWGPHGAPGRTTVAASLAHGLAARGGSILVDADVDAPSLNQLLYLPEQTVSIATAANLAARSVLDRETLERLLMPVGPGAWLLGGMGRAGRWRELPPVAMERVWSLCRGTVRWTVVDVAGGEIEEEVDSYTMEPGRGALVASLLRVADVIVVVGLADTIGVRRLVQILEGLRHMEGVGGLLQVVVNRLRPASAGPDPVGAVRRVLAGWVAPEDLVLLPEGPQADVAVMHGRSVLEDDAQCPLGVALTALVDRLEPGPSEPEPEPGGLGHWVRRSLHRWLP